MFPKHTCSVTGAEQEWTVNDMREKLVELIRQIVIPFWAGQIADHLISNDVVPVVRCKDCKRFFEYHPTYRRNRVEGADGDCLDRIINSDNRQFQGVKYSDFCSYGERKDGDTHENR